MGKQKTITLLLCLLGLGIFAQETQDSSFIRRGLIRTFGCFAFDYRMNQNDWDYRLHGFIEYFPEKKVSLMGEIYKYLDSRSDLPLIKSNSSLAVGIGYHWPRKNFDPYVFYMGGGNFYTSQVMLSDSTIFEEEWEGMPSHLNPMMAIGAGANLYVWKYLNFFVQFRYTHTFIYSNVHIKNMDSFSVSYGLGINFHTRKEGSPELDDM